eukprot:11685054-Heterocapsa_arctica.AAC.1
MVRRGWWRSSGGGWLRGSRSDSRQRQRGSDEDGHDVAPGWDERRSNSVPRLAPPSPEQEEGPLCVG